MSSADKAPFKGTSSQKPLPYKYSAGRYGTLFFAAFKAGRFLASRCGHCRTTLVPCRLICSKCSKPMTELVELSGEGAVAGFTQVNFPFIDPFTGKKRPIPYCYGRIRLDGTDNSFMGFLNVKDYRELKAGMRVRAVFKEERVGEMNDLSHFDVIGSGKEGAAK